MKKACTPAQVEERRKEIEQVVNEMFDQMDYQEITMKTISERISIARSSLYCYYPNIEEIFLDILKKDYIAYLKEEIQAFQNHPNEEELATSLSQIFLSHLRLMKMISIHLTDIEEHVSLEKLTIFKKEILPFQVELQKAMHTYYNSVEKEEFVYSTLVMLTHSLYPIISPNAKQKKAMEEANMPFIQNKEAFCYHYLLSILKTN